MEHFEGHQQQQVRQKSVYLLHLDTPRIILISSVVIGVVVGAFLIGMNFVKTSDEGLVASNGIVSESSSGNVFDTPIPSPPRGDEAESSAAPDLFPEREGSTDKPEIASHNPAESADVLTSESIKEIIPPATTVAKKTKPAAKHVKKAAPKRVAVKKPAKKRQVQAARASAVKKQRVVEVSAPVIYKKKISRDMPGYSIQVASYDKRSRALKEVDRLKRMRFDAFVDQSIVHGKQYYRVRIGPVSSQNRARDLLGDLHRLERYEESYIVRN